MQSAEIPAGSFACSLDCGHVRVLRTAIRRPTVGEEQYCAHCDDNYDVLRVIRTDLLPDGDIAIRRRQDSERIVPPSTSLPLTPRMFDVLRLAAAGMSNKQIAAMLQIAPATVDVHLGRIYRKLGVHTRAEAVSVAAREGWL